MKSSIAWVLVVIVVAAAAGGGYWTGHRHAGKTETTADKGESKPEEKPDKPSATVSVVPIRKATISEQITVYGSVVAPPNETRVASVPFESRVTKVLVAPGQPIATGQPLIEVEGSAATTLMLQEARNAVAAAERDLQLVRQRYEQKLATNAELNTAENALRLAQGRLQALEQGGAGGPRQLKADAPGVVSKVDVQIGQVVPIGGPLVEIATEDRIEAKVGVEPSDLAYLKPGQPVRLYRTDETGGEAIDGKIRLIGHRVDPMTRLTEVMISLPKNSRLLMESFVAAKMPRASATGLVVPREAVLPAEGGYTLFTVKEGKAVKHTVKIGIENDREAQVIADDVAEGDLAVVVGNYELDDGMEVKVQETITPPAATQAAETQPAGAEPPQTQPADTQPAETSQTQPAGTQPSQTPPAATQPSGTQPAGTQPSAAVSPGYEAVDSSLISQSRQGIELLSAGMEGRA
jgi:membrane fusion protein (multidrug efflux system)